MAASCLWNAVPQHLTLTMATGALYLTILKNVLYSAVSNGCWNTHTLTHTCTHARTHARTNTHTHTRTHAHTYKQTTVAQSSRIKTNHPPSFVRILVTVHLDFFVHIRQVDVVHAACFEASIQQISAVAGIVCATSQ